MATHTAGEIRIYVACLAAYNAGRLHGRWIDVTQGEDSIREEIAAMLRQSPCPNVRVDCLACDGAGCDQCGDSGKVPSAEEWAIHDYEGFHGLKLSESEDISTVAELAELLEEHGEAYAAYVDTVGEHYATPEDFQERYRGEWESAEAFADQLIDDGILGEVSDAVRPYIDVEKFAHDLDIGGDYNFVERGHNRVYVFDAH